MHAYAKIHLNNSSAETRILTNSEVIFKKVRLGP